ncbi:hypothetical protein DTO207G8_5420 [Paecilomyces variotii]|nr:hypothetical protein DTO169C6_8221 [Paecilomyces variotii]KAJ9251527.1 hypothetical protein DTO207G8_5420 [Paecilomyces variotii]KAJ9361641.1 hypothetical protein DTO027B9_802 [Paecilomyces variotii]
MIRGMFDHEWFGQVIIHLPFATLKAPKGPVLIIAPSMTLAQNWEMQWNLHVDGSHPRTGMVLVKGWIGVFSRARMLFIRNSKAFLRLSSFSNGRAVIVFRLFLLGFLMLGRLMDLPGSNNGYILALGNCWIQTVLVSDNLAQMNEGMWKDGQMFFKVGEITERIPNKRFRWTA